MKKGRLIFLSALGSGLEYFDFVIYALAVSYISHNFFPKGNALLSHLESLLVFATGYVVRPLGGLIFGVIGDKYGRKNSFTNAILLMSIATLAIAFLPSYQSIGLLSPLLLTLYRILQGIAQGAELAGAFTFIFEHEKEKHKAPKSLSFVTCGLGCGALLASLCFYILTLSFNADEMNDFAWRIPFFIGGSVALFAFILRKYSDETPDFLKAHPTNGHKPLKSLFFNYPLSLIKGIFIVLFPASFIISFLFLPSVFKDTYHYAPSTIYIAMTFSYVWSTLLIPFSGHLASRIGPKKQMTIGLVAALFIMPIMFYGLRLQTDLVLYLFVITYQSIIALIAACYGPILTNLFPTSIRYTGTAIAYNTAFAIAGFMPFVITLLLKQFNHIEVIPGFFSLLILAGLSALKKV